MDSISPITAPDSMVRADVLSRDIRRDGALKDMESLFLNELLKEMRKTIPDDGIFGKSPGRAMFQDMLDEVYAKKMAESNQLGIAEAIQKQLDLQEMQPQIRAKLLEAYAEGGMT